MEFYRKNEFLFWLLGLSIAIISIVYSVNADLVKQYGMEPIWNEEFIKRQLYLHEFFENKNKNDRKDIIEKLAAIDNITSQSTDSNTLNNQTSKIIFIIDRTGSTQEKLSEIIGKEKSKIFFNNISIKIHEKEQYNPIFFKNDDNSLSAATIITLNYLLSGKVKRDFAIAYYYTNKEFSLLEDKGNSTVNIWHKPSELLDTLNLQKIVDWMIDADKNKYINQKTRMKEIFRFVNYITKESDSLFYYCFLISDLLDEDENEDVKALKNYIDSIGREKNIFYKPILVRKDLPPVTNKKTEDISEVFNMTFKNIIEGKIDKDPECQNASFSEKKLLSLNCYKGDIGDKKNCLVGFIGNTDSLKLKYKLEADNNIVKNHTFFLGDKESDLVRNPYNSLSEKNYNECFDIKEPSFFVIPQHDIVNDKNFYLIDVKNKFKKKLVMRDRMDFISVEGLLLFSVIFMSSFFSIIFRFVYFIFEILFKKYYEKNLGVIILSSLLIVSFIAYIIISILILRAFNFKELYNISHFNLFNFPIAVSIFILILAITILSTISELRKLPNEK